MSGTGSVSITLAEGELFVPEYRGVDFRDVLGGTLDDGLKGSLWRAPPPGRAFSPMAGMSIGIAQGALDGFPEPPAAGVVAGVVEVSLGVGEAAGASAASAPPARGPPRPARPPPATADSIARHAQPRERVIGCPPTS